MSTNNLQTGTEFWVEEQQPFPLHHSTFATSLGFQFPASCCLYSSDAMLNFQHHYSSLQCHYYYQCWKQCVTQYFYINNTKFFRILWFKKVQKNSIFETKVFCNLINVNECKNLHKSTVHLVIRIHTKAFVRNIMSSHCNVPWF